MSGSDCEIRKAAEDIDEKTIRKMRFVMNAIDKGWSVRKRDDSYIFSKKHEGRKEIFRDVYLDNFIEEML